MPTAGAIHINTQKCGGGALFVAAKKKLPLELLGKML